MQIEWDQDYLLPKVIRSLLTLQPRVHAGEACTKEAEMETGTYTLLSHCRKCPLGKH